MFLWIFLSAAVILVNKYVLSVSGFPYPIALTCTHMLFCSVLAWVVVKLGFAEATPITPDTYIGCVHACLAWQQLEICADRCQTTSLATPAGAFCPSACCLPARCGPAMPRTYTCRCPSSKCSRYGAWRAAASMHAVTACMG